MCVCVFVVGTDHSRRFTKSNVLGDKDTPASNVWREEYVFAIPICRRHWLQLRLVVIVPVTTWPIAWKLRLHEARKLSGEIRERRGQVDEEEEAAGEGQRSGGFTSLCSLNTLSVCLSSGIQNQVTRHTCLHCSDTRVSFLFSQSVVRQMARGIAQGSGMNFFTRVKCGLHYFC